MHHTFISRSASKQWLKMPTLTSKCIHSADNNNNTADNVYGAVIIMTVIARVHPIHLMNECRLSARWPPTLRPNQPIWAVSPPKDWLLPSADTIAIYYYYSARKLILILPSH